MNSDEKLVRVAAGPTLGDGITPIEARRASRRSLFLAVASIATFSSYHDDDDNDEDKV